MSQIADQLRRDFKASDDIRDAGLTTPEDVVRYDDIRYGDESPLQALDLYRPRAAEGKTLPVIVSVHGGGWVYGDKERYQYYCMSLAQRGFAVVNFSYRLAPEWKYPAGMEDTNAVFHWVIDNAAKYGLDAGHVFGVGDSAGAHMLSIYSCICTNPDYAARYDFAPPLPGGGTDEEIALISPLEHMTAAFPPAFVMTANEDMLKPQAPVLVARLSELDVPFLYRYYGGRDVHLGHVFHCNMRLDAAALCNDEECDFFRRFL